MFELRVLSGRHQGAALPLCGEQWSIGHAEESDLLLTDAGVAGSHATLVCRDNVWQLQAMEGKIKNTGGHALTELNPLPENTPFCLGSVWLSLTPASLAWDEMVRPPETMPEPAKPVAAEKAAAEEPVPQPSRRFSRMMKVASVSLMLLLTFTIVSWIVQPTIAQTSTGEPHRPVLETLQEMRPPLLAMLRERNLTPGVKIDMEKGRMILSGELTKERLQILDRMLARFNSQYNAVPELVNNTQPLVAKLPFRIVQISTGKRANVVTEDGKRLFVGDQLEGVRLVSISDSQVEFAGNENIKVNW